MLWISKFLTFSIKRLKTKYTFMARLIFFGGGGGGEDILIFI